MSSPIASAAKRDLDTYCLSVPCEYYDPDTIVAACGVDGSTVPLTGRDSAEKIFNYFIGIGLKPFQAAGIMGNMQAESGLNPRALQPGTTGDAPISGRGFGLVQWTYPPRQDPLVQRAKDAKKLASDLRVQLDYVWWEMTQGPFKTVGDRLKKTTDVVSATKLVEDDYEIHAGGPQAIRVRYAQQFLSRFGSGVSPTGTGTSTSACGNSGQVSGGFSLPVDKKWYDDNKTWFTKPHHDYPAADIPVPLGTPVYSMTAGKVVRAPIETGDTGYGQGVWIDAGNGVVFIYGHGSDGGSIPDAKRGDTVKPGQLIMHSASTGHSTGPHLHLEIRINNTKVCPQQLFVAIVEGGNIDLNSLPKSGCTN